MEREGKSGAAPLSDADLAGASGGTAGVVVWKKYCANCGKETIPLKNSLCSGCNRAYPKVTK